MPNTGGELTSLGDEAISKGNREAFGKILKAIDGNSEADLADVAKAEALRVRQHFRRSEVPKGYRIPAMEIFRDPSLNSEDDLTLYQRIALLLDLRQDWRTRAKAASLLAGSRDIDAGDALVRSIKSDPDLNVAKEAQTALEVTWGYRGDLFDVPPIVKWWGEKRVGYDKK